MKPQVLSLLFCLVSLMLWTIIGLGFLALATLLSGLGLDVFGMVMGFALWIKILLSCVVAAIVLVILFVALVAARANAEIEAIGNRSEDPIDLTEVSDDVGSVQIDGINYKRSENVE